MRLPAFAPPLGLVSKHGYGGRAVLKHSLKWHSCQKVLFGERSSVRPVATLHLHEQSAPELDELVRWCAASGVQFHSLSLRQHGDNRGLFATQSIKPGDNLITIPRSAALIAETASADPPPSLHVLFPISPAFWKQAPWYIRLAVILLDHVHNPQSQFAAYIAALPKDPGCILWAYHVHKRSALSAHLSRYHMEGAAEVARSQCKHQFIMFKNALPLHLHDVVDIMQFSWSVSICISRAFGLPPGGNPSRVVQQVPLPMKDGISIHEPKEYALFPGLDMTNCSVRCKTSFKYEKEADSFVVSTGMSFESGRQVFVSYGSKPNDDLMLFYGFVEGLNPANCVLVPDFREWVTSVAESCSSYPTDLESKLKILVAENLLCPKHSIRIENDRIDDDLMFSLRIALATRDELNVIQELLESSSVKKKTRSISLQNEVAAWGAVERKCSELLHEIDAFSREELQRLDDMYSHTPCTAAWVWDEYESDGELLYRYERHRVLNSTIERMQHFAKVSTAIGRVCTVLMPPSQSMIRADIFETGVAERDTSGVNRFSVTAEDIQDIQRSLNL